MGKHVKHILILCHEDDRHDMTALLAGMAAHSDFMNWNLREFFEADSDNSHPSLTPLWYGFTTEKFPWEVMASLLASVNWKREGAISIQLERDGTFEVYAVRQFFHAVREGKIK